MERRMPTVNDILSARKTFEEVEPRSLFYRAATELVALAIDRKTNLKVAEAIAVLLQTWNVTFYRFTKFNLKHFSNLEELLVKHDVELRKLRHRRIEAAETGDTATVQMLFGDFELLLGPVGAVKCLHLMAPKFFPLWDNEIATKLGCRLAKRGTNAPQYRRFFECSKQQVQALASEEGRIPDPLKALDEYNYVTYTLPKLLANRKKPLGGVLGIRV